jgi:tetratricopeptide (TPR) repeat protein
VRKSTTGRGKSDTAFETTQEAGWEPLSRAGEDEFKNGHFQLAAKHFSQAVQEAEQFGEGDARLGKTLNRLGTAQCRLARYPEAKRSLKRAARILEQILGASDASVLEAPYNLAGAYKATGEYQPSQVNLRPCSGRSGGFGRARPRLYRIALKSGDSDRRTKPGTAAGNKSARRTRKVRPGCQIAAAVGDRTAAREQRIVPAAFRNARVAHVEIRCVILLWYKTEIKEREGVRTLAWLWRLKLRHRL